MRWSGTDTSMIELAKKNATAIGAGHSFILFLGDGFFPLNVLNTLKMVPEVCRIFCATANPTEVVLAETETGRGILGVVDGFSPKGVEDEGEIKWRKDFLRQHRVQAVMVEWMNSLGRILVLTAAVVAVSLGLAGEERPLKDGPERMAYLDNGIIKVGVDLDRGGSIGFLADVKKGGNVVNVHDLGSWIGQSYYAGPKPFGTPHPGLEGLALEPGQRRRRLRQRLEAASRRRTTARPCTSSPVPMQWALKNVPGDCTFETWITLEGRTVQVRNRLTNQRKDEKQYPAMDQELPAVYTIGKLHRLMTYTGDSPFADKPLTEIPKQPAKDGRPQWTTFFATEHWAALVDDDDWGLGVIHPGCRSVPRRLPRQAEHGRSQRRSDRLPRTRAAGNPRPQHRLRIPLHARPRLPGEHPQGSLPGNVRNLLCPTTASRRTASTGGL